MIDTTFATICSLLPYDLNESKPGLFPSEYRITSARNKSFGLTIISNNIYYLVNPDILADAKEVRLIRVPVPAIELAQSIINDYSSGMLGVDIPDAAPGLMAVPGNYSNPSEFALQFNAQITETRNIQNRWFRNLIDMADDSWTKMKSPLSISDLQRYAVDALKLEREWARPELPELQTRCPFCQNSINPGAIKCLSCGEILNKAKYQELVGTGNVVHAK